jgi:filamentous hemagglutinin family protein
MLGAVIALALGVRTASAQSTIVPDDTLATEASVVNSLDLNLPVDIINGGAIQGNNLFHSFSQFNVGANRGVYFFSFSANIVNILARVTGGSRSEILGTLGTLGKSQPNLFLINPNGIIFGANATLDVGKSFVATTADGVQFGNQGIFSATKPEAPSLLTVNPSALLVNQIANSGNIINQSVATVPVLRGFINGTPAERGRNGLGVVSGESLLLVGANINLDGGFLRAPGGRVELAAVTNGIVGLESADGSFKLNVLDNAVRGDISINQGIISTPNGKEVQLIGNNINLSDGSGVGGYGLEQVNIRASQFQVSNGSIILALPTEVSAAGNIDIESDNFSLQEISKVDGVNIRLRSDDITLDTSFIGGKNTSLVAIGTNSIKLSNNSIIAASTLNPEQASKIQIQARDSVDITNQSFIGNIFNLGDSNIPSSATDVEISTRQLTMQNQGGIFSASSNSKILGNITIRASDKVILANNSGISSSNFYTTSSSGNILIETDLLTLDSFSGIASSTFETGNSGEVILRIKDAVELSNNSFINSNANFGSTGQAGNLTIQTERLSLKKRQFY